MSTDDLFKEMRAAADSWAAGLIDGNALHSAVVDYTDAVQLAALSSKQEPSYHIEDNITGARASRDFPSWSVAVGTCRTLNLTASGGRYGIYDQNGQRRSEPQS